jgi:hypothetical protein
MEPPSSDTKKNDTIPYIVEISASNEVAYSSINDKIDPQRYGYDDIDNSKSSYLIPVRSTLVTNVEFPVMYGANGAIIFTSKPNKERGLQICKAYINDFNDVGKFDSFKDINLKKLMVTHWLLNEYIAHIDSENCNTLLEKYDYPRAEIIAAKAKMTGISEVFLIAFPNTNNFENSIIIDMSNFSNQDISRALELWKKHISRGRNEWSTGLKFDIAVNEFRSLIQKYGETILIKFKKRV